MLAREEEKDVSVTWQDQEHINTFSWKNARKHELNELIKQLKAKDVVLSDAFAEILESTDEKFKLYSGEVYFEVSSEDAQAQIEKEQEKVAADLEKYNSELDLVLKELTRLKGVLYGKFGKSINLEE